MCSSPLHEKKTLIVLNLRKRLKFILNCSNFDSYNIVHMSLAKIEAMLTLWYCSWFTTNQSPVVFDISTCYMEESSRS